MISRQLHPSTFPRLARQRAPLYYHCRRRPYSITPSGNNDARKAPDLRSQLPASALPITSHTTIPDEDESRARLQAKRSLRPYIYAMLGILTGCLAGNFVNAIIAPPPPPVPHTPDDHLMTTYLAAQAVQLPCVQALLADPLWTTSDTLLEPGTGSYITDTLAGARGLTGYQKLFTHTTTGDIVLILWLGSSLASWPGVVHGGALATVMDETLRRCALGSRDAPVGGTLNLQMNYRKPVLTNSFYVVRAAPAVSDENTSSLMDRAASATLATVSDVICVEANGVFSVPEV